MRSPKKTRSSKTLCVITAIFLLAASVLFAVGASAEVYDFGVPENVGGRSAEDPNTGEYENGSDTARVPDGTDIGAETTDDIWGSTSDTDEVTSHSASPSEPESGPAEDTAGGTSTAGIVIAVAVAVAIIILIIVLIPKSDRSRKK